MTAEPTLSPTKKYAYISVLSSDNFFPGLKNLIRSVKRTKPIYAFYVLMPISSSAKLQNKVSKLGVQVILSEDITLSCADQLSNTVQHWNNTFFKLNILNLTQFDKLVYLDSDMLVIKNLDHLFSYPSFSATTGGKAAHPEWTEFNSGIMVLSPNQDQFKRLIECIPSAIQRKKQANAGFGDQDVFNDFFPEWSNHPSHKFPESYNAISIFLDALMAHDHLTSLNQLHVIHYIGSPKIWELSFFRKLRIIRSCYINNKKFEAQAYLLYMFQTLLLL